MGTLIALRGTTLSAELTGTVREIGFENGSLVKKGQVIVRLDTSAEQAQLASAQADAALAKQTLEPGRGPPQAGGEHPGRAGDRPGA